MRWGGVTPWMNLQGTVEATTGGGSDAFVLVKHLDFRLASADFLQIAARLFLAVIPSTDDALRDLGTFVFVALHLLSVGGGG